MAPFTDGILGCEYEIGAFLFKSVNLFSTNFGDIYILNDLIKRSCWENFMFIGTLYITFYLSKNIFIMCNEDLKKIITKDD